MGGPQRCKLQHFDCGSGETLTRVGTQVDDEDGENCGHSKRDAAGTGTGETDGADGSTAESTGSEAAIGGSSGETGELTEPCGKDAGSIASGVTAGHGVPSTGAGTVTTGETRGWCMGPTTGVVDTDSTRRTLSLWPE